jgi:AraC-like DNA-binding protein
MKLAQLDDLRIVELTSDAATVIRNRAHIARSAEPLFVLRMQLDGESVTYQEGREARLRPGDFTLCDCSRPYKVEFRDRAVMLAVRIPRATLLRYVAAPEAMISIPMSGASGPSALTSRCLQEFWRSSQWLAPTLTPRIANIMLELIASAYASLPQAQADQAASKTALRARIFEYIEKHLGDADLTPTSIAHALRITPRYLHLLFGSERETVARYILRRRLEKCSQVLVDPKHRGRSISLISSSHGFKSMPHFCRTFREQYGMRPGEYRRTAVDTVD